MEEIKELMIKLLMELEDITVEELFQFKSAWIKAAKENGNYTYMEPIIDRITDYELKRKTQIA